MAGDTFRRLIRRWIPLVFLLPAAYLLRPIFWTPLDHRFYNYFLSKRSVPEWKDVVAVEIDEATRTEVFTPPIYPLSRHVAQHERITRQLDKAGVRAIVFDLRLSEDDFDAPPLQLADAFRSAGKVFLVAALVEERRVDSMGKESLLIQAVMPHEELVGASNGAFAIDVKVDPDGVLRRYHLDPRLEAVDLEALPERLSGYKLQRIIPIEFPSESRPMPTVSYRDVLYDLEKVEPLLAGRIAFIGSVLDEPIDYVVVPRMQSLGKGRKAFLLPGVAALAAVTETLLRGAPLVDASWPIVLLWNLLWCLLVITIMARKKPIRSVLLLLAVLLASLAATGILHSSVGFVIPGGLLLGCVGMAGVYTLSESYFLTSKELFITLKRSHDELEIKVRERTAELADANEELSKTIRTLKSTQAQLVQSEKLASLGNLVAGIAHEVNNPIGTVNSSADVLRRCIERIEKTIELGATSYRDNLTQALEIMKETNLASTDAGQKIASIVKSLRNFARLDEAEFQKADIHEGIDNTITLVNHELRDKIVVERDYGNIPKIACYASELNQVFMNLLLNASQSIEDKGTIRIKTHIINSMIHVEISDTGRGIPPEDIDKIFDPGFTTKHVRVGTGLGLPICYNIIRKHKGEIKVKSRLSEGSTFTIILPMDLKR